MSNKNFSFSSHNAKREKQTRYLSQAIQLEEAVNPHIIQATMSMVSIALLAFVLWAAYTNINEVARTPGEVVPRGYQKTVQHLEGGIVKAIHVREGQIVQSGDILLTLDDASIKEDIERTRIKQTGLEMQSERLRAYLENRKPDFSGYKLTSAEGQDQASFFEGMKSARDTEADIIRKQIEEKSQAIKSLQTDLQTSRSNLGIAQDIYARRSRLNARGYASDMQLLDDQARLTQNRGDIGRLESQIVQAKSEVEQFQRRLKSLSAQHRDETLEKLSAITLEMAQNEKIIEKLQERIGRLDIRSSSRGLIKGLSVNTIGAVIKPGETLMEIVPLDEQLEVSVKISPQDIGHLRVGQSVQVKFSTYDFSRYGLITGKLDQISASTFAAENGERFYQGRVLLDKNYVGENKSNIIMPGMTVMADVITGEKTILQYLLKPIHLSLQTAFSER
jgi:membrane fusion protein, adhesin transport system